MIARTVRLLTALLLLILMNLADSQQRMVKGEELLEPMQTRRLVTPPGEALQRLNQTRWFWYSPDEWHLPAYLRPPVIISMDATGPWYAPWDFIDTPFATRNAANASAASKFTPPSRGQAKAYRWNEQTGEAEPMEVKRWGRAGINGE